MKMDSKIIISNLSHLMGNCRLIEIAEPDEKDIKNAISQLESFKSYTLVFISEVVEMVKDQNHSFLVLLNITYTHKDSKIPVHERSHIESEIIGIAYLNKDYGSLLVRPETISDKISELFNRTEIDFDMDKQFSDKCYVRAIDEDKTRVAVTENFLKAFKGFKGLEVEINGHVLMARLRKGFSAENGKIIADFIAQINDGEN